MASSRRRNRKRRRAEPERIWSPLGAFVAVTAYVGGTVLPVIFAASVAGLSPTACYVVAAVVGIPVAARATRTSIEVGDAYFLVRNGLLTHRLRWEEIEEIAVRDSGFLFSLRAAVARTSGLRVRTRQGRSLWVDVYFGGPDLQIRRAVRRYASRYGIKLKSEFSHGWGG